MLVSCWGRICFSMGLVMTWGMTFQKGAGGGEVVIMSLWDQKELMFQQSIRTYDDGCQIFQCCGVSACFCLKWDYHVLQCSALWFINRHVTSLSRSLFILFQFQKAFVQIAINSFRLNFTLYQNIPSEVWRNACGWDCTKLGSSYPELLHNVAVAS